MLFEAPPTYLNQTRAILARSHSCGPSPTAQGDCRVIALSETTREQVVQSINLFLASMVYRVLIVSYEVGEAVPFHQYVSYF